MFLTFPVFFWIFKGINYSNIFCQTNCFTIYWLLRLGQVHFLFFWDGINVCFFYYYSWWNFPSILHWNLNDSKSLQVSKTLFSIRVNLNNAVVWMVSAFPFNLHSSSMFLQVLRLQSVSPSPSCFTLFYLSNKVQVFVYIFVFFYFTRCSAVTAKSTRWQVLFS